MKVLVTGAAGFVGYHVSAALLARGDAVIGVDDLNPYYDVALKETRLARMTVDDGITFHKLDIAERGALASACSGTGIERVVHLAAQAGVRHSLDDPFAYARINVTSHLEVLELCRHLDGLEHLVYASSSSVYGGNDKQPFAETDRVDRQFSLYGATKKADELMSHSYSHLFGLPATGIRLFTVYGPWGRPDMAACIFARAIFAGAPISVFNRGDMRRAFTYIDDAAGGIVAALDNPPPAGSGGFPHRVYNIGNDRAEALMDFIAALEAAIGRKAVIELAPMQPGDVKETVADISAARRDLGFAPTTPIAVGLPRFVAWYRDYHGL